MSGLAGLHRMLEQHFKKKLVVLIDEYDSVINNGVFRLKTNSEFQDVLDLTSDLLTRLLKKNEDVQIMVVTGISYNSTTGLSDINNLS